MLEVVVTAEQRSSVGRAASNLSLACVPSTAWPRTFGLRASCVLLPTRVSLRHDLAEEAYMVGGISQCLGQSLFWSPLEQQKASFMLYAEKCQRVLLKNQSLTTGSTGGNMHTPALTPSSQLWVRPPAPQPTGLNHILCPPPPCHWKGKHFKHDMMEVREYFPLKYLFFPR